MKKILILFLAFLMSNVQIVFGQFATDDEIVGYTVKFRPELWDFTTPYVMRGNELVPTTITNPSETIFSFKEKVSIDGKKYYKIETSDGYIYIRTTFSNLYRQYVCASNKKPEKKPVANENSSKNNSANKQPDNSSSTKVNRTLKSISDIHYIDITQCKLKNIKEKLIIQNKYYPVRLNHQDISTIYFLEYDANLEAFKSQQKSKGPSFARASNSYSGKIYPEFTSYRYYQSDPGFIRSGLSERDWRWEVFDMTGEDPSDLVSRCEQRYGYANEYPNHLTESEFIRYGLTEEEMKEIIYKSSSTNSYNKQLLNQTFTSKYDPIATSKAESAPFLALVLTGIVVTHEITFINETRVIYNLIGGVDKQKLPYDYQARLQVMEIANDLTEKNIYNYSIKNGKIEVYKPDSYKPVDILTIIDNNTLKDQNDRVFKIKQ